MASGKRNREPDEAPEYTNKNRKKSQASGPVLRPNSRNDKAEELGRPTTSSHRHHSSPAQSPPIRSDRGRRPRLNLSTSFNQLRQSREQPGDPPSSHSETSTSYSRDEANYDVQSSVEAVGTPQVQDIEFWGSVEGAAEFIRSQSGLESNWVGTRPLGKGSFGIAGLWELRGDDGRLRKQMVIKEESHPRDIWNNFSYIRAVPREVKIMSKLNKTSCHAIPRLFAYKRYPHVYKHRIYMEHCPFKDLSVLCSRYSRFRQLLPEPFLWDTFSHLVEAAVAMRFPRGQPVPEDGELNFEVVHRDLKPSNVFLGQENAEKGFPFYPVTKVGDFGLAVMTSDRDANNPNAYRGAGSEGYMAPEQIKDETPEEERDQLSSYTNVWAIGAVMVELLTLYAHCDLVNDSSYVIDGKLKPLQTNKKPEYSEHLRTLIERCVDPDPLERIKLRELRERVDHYRDSMNEFYRQTDDTGKARFRSTNLLYYVRNEINNMPTGDFSPISAVSPSRPDLGEFPDRDHPVVFPRFDGPEARGGGGDPKGSGSGSGSGSDSDSDSNSGSDSDHNDNNPGALIMGKKRSDYQDDDWMNTGDERATNQRPTSQRAASQRAAGQNAEYGNSHNPATREPGLSSGGGSGNQPLNEIISEDAAIEDEDVDGSPHNSTTEDPRPNSGGFPIVPTRVTIPDDAAIEEEGEGYVGDEGPASESSHNLIIGELSHSSGLSSVPTVVTISDDAAIEDGGAEEMEDDLTDGLPGSASGDAAEGASQDGASDSVAISPPLSENQLPSPPPPAAAPPQATAPAPQPSPRRLRSGRIRQVLAPAAAPAPATASAPQPSPRRLRSGRIRQVLAPAAPAAPTPTPAPPPSPRRLRSGRVFAHT